MAWTSGGGLAVATAAIRKRTRTLSKMEVRFTMRAMVTPQWRQVYRLPAYRLKERQQRGCLILAFCARCSETVGETTATRSAAASAGNSAGIVCENRVLVSATDLAQPHPFRQNILQQRIVIEHKHRPGML